MPPSWRCSLVVSWRQSQDAAPTDQWLRSPNPAAPAESLAKANQELETLRAEYERLRLQTEALGLAGLKPELRPLQERLLAAVSDYRLADRRAKELTEAGRQSLRSLPGVAQRSAGQDQPGPPPTGTCRRQPIPGRRQSRNGRRSRLHSESAKVISLKNDLGLAVINTGAESGLRLGTPMRLVRGEKIVATGLVVDVRSRIAGLLMTSTSSAGALKVGDLAKPETISTLK